MLYGIIYGRVVVSGGVWLAVSRVTYRARQEMT